MPPYGGTPLEPDELKAVAAYVYAISRRRRFNRYLPGENTHRGDMHREALARGSPIRGTPECFFCLSVDKSLRPHL